MPLDHGRHKSQPARRPCEQEAFNILRRDLRPYERPQIVEAEGDEILVEVAEAWRQRDRLDPGSCGACGQSRHGTIAGGIDVAGDVESPERVRKEDSR